MIQSMVLLQTKASPHISEGSLNLRFRLRQFSLKVKQEFLHHHR